MKNIHLILIIAILILIYLISMQWLWRNRESPPIMSPVEEVVETANMPANETTVIAPEVVEESKPIVPTLPEEKVPEIIPETTEEKTDPKLVEYKNTNYGYHLSFPKKMYYAGFGARNGALHSLAIQEEALPEEFGTATTRVFFYGKKILPELQNASNNRYKDPNGKYILLLLDDTYSVRIESDNLQSATVQAIISTIGVDSK